MSFLDPNTKLISYGLLRLSFYDLLFIAFVLVFAFFRHMILKWSALSPTTDVPTDVPLDVPLDIPSSEDPSLSISLFEEPETPTDPMDALRLD
jgi:hypothetical protein